jgi:hypothetical protein
MLIARHYSLHGKGTLTSSSQCLGFIIWKGFAPHKVQNEIFFTTVVTAVLGLLLLMCECYGKKYDSTTLIRDIESRNINF